MINDCCGADNHVQLTNRIGLLGAYEGYALTKGHNSPIMYKEEGLKLVATAWQALSKAKIVQTRASHKSDHITCLHKRIPFACVRG